MNAFYVEPDYELKEVGIDLDGTLAYAVWPEPGIGEPIYDNVEKLLDLVKAGYKPFIYTSRPSSDKRMIKAWLKEHNLPVTDVVTGKPLCHKIVDDRCVPAGADSWL